MEPAPERTWHGKVAGVVPYDFRVPTVDRIREAYWAPESERVFSEKVIGVGWAVNVPTAARKLNELVSQYVDASARLRMRAPEPRALPDDERGSR